MNTLALELTGLLCMLIIIMLLILIVLEQNIFRKKLKHLLTIKTLKQIFTESFVKNKNIKTNIFRIQAQDSAMCRYFCFEFIDFKFKGKTFTEYKNLFSPNNFENNDGIILSYFKNK